MLSLSLLDNADTALQARQANELLTLNEKLQKHGLVLTPACVEQILAERKSTLKSHGRIELDIGVTKVLIAKLGESPYVGNGNLVSCVDDLYEAYHAVKNATSDFVPDEEIIDAIISCFNTVCGGSTELLLGKGVAGILENYGGRKKLDDFSREGEEEYWYFDE